MPPAQARLLELLKTQCRIFSTTFNPERLRMGNKVLRERLRGPSVAAYYPRRIVTLKDLTEAYPDTITWDEKEQDRLDSVQLTQSRGKGPPKKKRTAADSKQFQKKRKEAPAKKVPTF